MLRFILTWNFFGRRPAYEEQARPEFGLISIDVEPLLYPSEILFRLLATIENTRWHCSDVWLIQLRYLVSVVVKRMCTANGIFEILHLCDDKSSAGHPGRDRTSVVRISLGCQTHWLWLGREVGSTLSVGRIVYGLYYGTARVIAWEEQKSDIWGSARQASSCVTTLEAGAQLISMSRRCSKHHGFEHSRSIILDCDPRCTSKMYGDIFKQLGLEY